MRSLLAVVVFVVGCHEAPSGSQAGATGDADALWALAPDGMTAGMIVTPRAITMIDHAWHDVRALLAREPELSEAASMLDHELAELGVAGELSDLGLAPAKGAAMFTTGPGGDTLYVLPLADRDKWLAITHGIKSNDGDHVKAMICNPVAAYYACASRSELFARIGKGKLRDQLAPIGARGDFEFVANGLPLIGKSLAVAGVAQLSRGMVVVRNAFGHLPPDVLEYVGAPTRPRVDEGRTSGFVLVDVRPFVPLLPPELRDIGKTISGPITLIVNPDPDAFDLRTPLSDPAPVQALLARCGELDGVGGMTAKLVEGGCQLTIPSFEGTLEVWLEDGQLRIGTRHGAAPVAAGPLTPLGAEIAHGEWAFAMWGRGTAFAQGHVDPKVATLPQASAVLRVMSLFAEGGLALRLEGDRMTSVMALRTIWSNPDDVFARLAAIPTSALMTASAASSAKAIADAAPSSPFASDFKAGTDGLMLTTAVTGIAAAFAIPSLLDSMKKPRKLEAPTQLARIAKASKAYFAEAGGFPVGKVVTPEKSCCTFPGAKCLAEPSAWTKSTVWSVLGFSIDQPTLFQYAYHSDGKSFTAEAIGDLDCDGTMITYQLAGKIEGGTVTTQLTEPAPNTD